MKRKLAPVRTTRRMPWGLLAVLAGVLVGGAVLKMCWDAWNSPHRRLTRGLAAGQTEFKLTELVGKKWAKACVVPVGGYIWDSDFQTPGDDVTEFFNHQFGGTRPGGFSSDGTFVYLYVEDEKVRRHWNYIGQRRHPHISEDQQPSAPYWDVLVGNSGVLVACTENKNAAVLVKEKLFFTRNFESQYRFVHKEGNEFGQRLITWNTQQ